MWQQVEFWENWKNSDIRSDNEAGLEEISEGPGEYEVFSMGTYV
jgi:hypothetical protein